MKAGGVSEQDRSITRTSHSERSFNFFKSLYGFAVGPTSPGESQRDRGIYRLNGQ